MSDHVPLAQLDGADAFVDRHLGVAAEDREKMLATLGFGSLDALMRAALPAGARLAEEPSAGAASAPLDLPSPATEQQAAAELRSLAARNNPLAAMIGLGYHGTITPAVIRRNVLEDPSWYTAYTPYQPEISQGRLEALLNFQTMVGRPHRPAHRQRAPCSTRPPRPPRR